MFSTPLQAPRILSSRAFRRLAHKTHVVSLPSNDHVATRMTHTLEVASLAREIAARLVESGVSVDVDLLESIALAHDVGHPPFGHAGEAALARRAADAGLGGFHHAAFGVRLLSRLERDDEGTPVVTNAAVLDGILAHSKGKTGPPFARGASIRRRSIEAQIARAADLFAYASFDLDDARRLGVFGADALPNRCARTLGRHGAAVRRSLVERAVAATLEASDGTIHLDDDADRALAELRAFLYERFYEGPPTVEQTRYADQVIGRVWGIFLANLTAALEAVGWRRHDDAEAPTSRDALDAIACMTDRFAIAFARGSPSRSEAHCRSRSPVLTTS